MELETLTFQSVVTEDGTPMDAMFDYEIIMLLLRCR